MIIFNQPGLFGNPSNSRKAFYALGPYYVHQIGISRMLNTFPRRHIAIGID